MRVYLAVQVVSQTMKRIIIQHTPKCGGIDSNSSLIDLIDNIDQYVENQTIFLNYFLSIITFNDY